MLIAKIISIIAFIEKYFVDHKNVNVVDTGLKAQTGTRIKRIKN